MNPTRLEINYQASPTGALLHASPAIVRGIRGSVGSGKTVVCINEALRISFDQHPNKDGIRKTRGVIVRNTGPELRTTTLNTWKQWIPETVAPIVMHPVITCKLIQPLADGTTVEMEVYFLALDTDADVKKLLSLEATWIMLNEARELPYSVVKAARERIGRYPSAIDGYRDAGAYKAPRDAEGNYQPCKRKAVLMDTNPPDDDHWWYQLAEEGCLRNAQNPERAKEQVKEVFEFFSCPSPLIQQPDGTYKPNPQADNIQYLPGGYKYYLDMLAGNTQEHINVMVLGQYGNIAEGRPVYTAYRDAIHCPPEGTKAIKGLPIAIGLDFGLQPSAAIGQLTPEGQLRVVAEVTSDDLDARAFARDVLKPFLDHYFRGYRIAFCLGDPSGDSRGEGEGRSAIGILNDDYDDEVSEPLNLGFVVEPAPTNDPTRRVDAVQQFMLKLVGKGEPGYLLNKACKKLRKGKQGGYCLKRIAVSGKEGLFRDKPDKGPLSHVADAEQYLALGFTHGYATDQAPEEENEYEMYGSRQTSAMGY